MLGDPAPPPPGLIIRAPPRRGPPANHLHVSSPHSQDLAILLVMLAGAVSVFRLFIFKQASCGGVCCAWICRRSACRPSLWGGPGPAYNKQPALRSIIEARPPQLARQPSSGFALPPLQPAHGS